jgi:hypothetical protein
MQNKRNVLLIFVFTTIITTQCRPAAEIESRSHAGTAAGLEVSGRVESSVKSIAESNWIPERPLPQPVIPPRGYRNAMDNGTRTTDGQPGDNYWQQFTEYAIDATLYPDEKRLSATAHITYHNHSPDRLPRLYLELAQNLHAEGVVRNRPAEVTGGIQLIRVVANGIELNDETGALNRYNVQGTRMMIQLHDAVRPGESAEIEIEYDFVIPQRGAGGRMGYSRDNLFYLGYWYPHMVVYDDVVGWHPDPYLGQAEFYHGFGDYELNIRAPAGWLVMATGELMNADEVLEPDVRERWWQAKRSDTPVRVYTAGADAGTERELNPGREINSEREINSDKYLNWKFSASQVRDVAFSATRASNWDAARTPVGDLTGDGSTDYTVVNTFWREEAPLWSEVTAYQQHAITFLSEVTGFSYPWPHMTAVEGAGIIGGGMEFPMMTIMGDYNERGAEALYSVTAHELAHMWIPLIVSTDERRYSWLDEGNTVFKTSEAVMDYYPNRRPHQQSMTAYVSAARQENEEPMMRRSDYHYTTTRFIIASYRKPSAVLGALRKKLGDDLFWEAYRLFVNEWAFKQAYPWDFFRTFERVSGRDLDWFWHSWYYTTWVLNQAVESVEATRDGTRIVIRDEGKVPMPVYLTVTDNRNRLTEYKIPVDRWLEGHRTAEIIVPHRQVQRVEIDAGRNLPDINRQNAVWER